MGQVIKRYPRFDIKFYTEEDSYYIKYDASQGATDDFMGQSVISLSTKNAMEDDSAVFSFLLAGDVYWDRILKANDAVTLSITPSEEGDQPENPVLLVGMISEVQLEGDYGENSKMYRITGQSFAKAFINFEIGVIQEVQVVLTDIGWLPDSAEDGGIDMTQKTASQLAEGIVQHFLPYMKYSYKDIGGLDKFLTWQLDSWQDEERLADITPFINYEGTLKQMLDDVTGKPFNELFFDATTDGKCQMTMRRTPFDQADWTKLPAYYATSKDVISESVSINDQEAFTIFNISQSNNLLGASGVELDAYPQYFDELFKKFGYKRVEVEFRYLDTAVISDDDDTEEADTDSTGAKEDEDKDKDDKKDEDNTTSSSRARTASKKDSEGKPFTEAYNITTSFLGAYKKDRLRVLKNKVATSITKVDNRITKESAENIVQFYIENKNWTKEDFSRLTGIQLDDEALQADKTKPTYKKVTEFMKKNATTEVTTLKNKLLAEFKLTDDQAVSIASEFIAGSNNISEKKYKAIMKDRSKEGMESIGTASEFLSDFKKRLANWYCENPNFYSGDIVVKGSPDYRLGGRLFLTDEQNDELWEYYIESVQHSYSYTSGYTTTLGVTRGLQNNGNARFSNLWGKSKDFKGGLMGEMSMEELLKLQAEEDKKNQVNNNNSGGGNSSGNSGGGSNIPGSTIATKAVNYAKANSRSQGKESYYLWGGGHGSADPFASQPYGMDCSAFVWWVFHKAGYDIGGASAGTTWTMLNDSNLETISSQGSKDPNLSNKMKVGDIIWFYGDNGHIGIYIGDGKWIGCNGFPPEDHSATAGIQISDLFTGWWWNEFNGNVKRVK